jgi:hypothetical protein
VEPRCFQCGGPYHEATGHVFRKDVVYCGPCAREFFFGFYRPRMIYMSIQSRRKIVRCCEPCARALFRYFRLRGRRWMHSFCAEATTSREKL